MTNPDFRTLCAELLTDYEQNRFRAELAAYARAVLAQPEPQRKDCPGCEGTPVASNSPCAV